MAALSVEFSLPSLSLFSFPPTQAVPAIPPPPGQPFFDISPEAFQAALDPKVPITIAAIYALSAKALNAYNISRNKKPWRISKTKIFKAFVIAHNIFLAVYSAWTFVGMFGTLRRSIASPTGPNGLAGTIDSLCKLHGNTGLGNGVFYDETLASWSGAPSMVDTGRIWNEGLAYYGWWFYLSKFYEVFDTLIILAKGKLSSTLQTYHHAGAMMCMWAGIRFMSAPIWMFVFVNSGIHAMMYTYYTLTAFGIRVPMAIKRSLTTMQITQFLVGASYAMIHSFVSYTVPVSVPIMSIKSSSTDGSADPIPSGANAAIDNIKSMIWGSDPSSAAEAGATPVAELAEKVVETVTRHEKIPCMTTTGETFAIWLNVVYLAPLTYLFVSFFITSYMRRSAQVAKKGKAERRMSASVEVAEKASWDAASNVTREVYDQGVEAPVVTSSEDETEKMSRVGKRKTGSRQA